MLHEPEASIVRHWLDNGGAIKPIPFGVSGHAWSFGQLARKSGAWGAFKRHGTRHIDADAVAWIAAGYLTMAQARVPAAWDALVEHGPMNGAQLGRLLNLHGEVAGHILVEIVLLRAGEIVANARYYTVRATGRRPEWTAFLPAQMRAA